MANKSNVNLRVSISEGNAKMGKIRSVSLPPVVTCRANCPCAKKCYALKLCRIRKTVKAAYDRNLMILDENPELYWREVEAAVMVSKFFRFHVSGDIPNAEYFESMVALAEKYTDCQMLAFTKQFEIVNEYLYKHNGKLPENLHIIFSAWEGLIMNNPFDLPEAHVKYRDGRTTAKAIASTCGGNCTECSRTNAGCWALKRGEQVVLDEH